MDDVGAVVIGRNEGVRLRRCLESLAARVSACVYVDSGSTDGSLALARDLGVDVVTLDMATPFTAARARNQGIERLRERAPGLRYVQVVDGDCVLAQTWLEAAVAALEAHPDVAVVCGRRRERAPDASVYNLLCDLEWDTPIGFADACGGDATFRLDALAQVGGYDDSLIAGEEPELCVRLRGAGWKVLRVDAEMTLHDAAMTSFRQWWRRNLRAGHAFAEVAWLHRETATGIWRREVRSNWVWGLAVPGAAIAAAPATLGTSLGLLAAYPALGWRIYRTRRRRGTPGPTAVTYAAFTVIGKAPTALGQLRFHMNRLLNRRSGLIEYKGARDGAPPSG